MRCITACLACLTVGLIAGGCSSDTNAPAQGEASAYHVLGGPATCDACGTVDLTVAGPGLDRVVDGSLRYRDAAHTTVAADLQIHHFVGDSGLVVQVEATFSDSLPVGDYDLLLDTVGPTGTAGTLTVARALTVTTARPGEGPSGPSGKVHVVAQATGTDIDTEYDVILSPCVTYTNCSRHLVVRAGVGVEFVVSPGSYNITLSGIADNCTARTPNPAPATVAVNATTEVAFNITCVALPPSGTFHVTATTTGPDPDPSYLVTVGDCSNYNCSSSLLQRGGAVEFKVPAGTYPIALNDVAPNCTVAGANPVSLSVDANATTNVTFTVTCVAIPLPGTVRVTPSPTGADIDQSYRIRLGDCGSYYGVCQQQVVSAGGFAEFSVPAGSYPLQLIDVASNCTVTGANPTTVVATSGAVTNVTFAVSCIAVPPPGDVRVAALATGQDVDADFQVRLGTCDYTQCTVRDLIGSDAVTFQLTPGTYTFTLLGLADNCQVAAPNPATVTVVSGATTNLTFSVTCTALGAVLITAPTTGTNLPTGAYFTDNEDACDYYYGCRKLPLGINGSVSYALAAGTHHFRLSNVPVNCRVTVTNPATVVVTAGQTTNLAFPVECH